MSIGPFVFYTRVKLGGTKVDEFEIHFGRRNKNLLD